jgi:hypothetical protein
MLETETIYDHDGDALAMPSRNGGDEEPRTGERIHELALIIRETETNRKRDHEENQAMLIETRDLAKQTNGRVTKLEAWKRWVSGVVTGVTVLFVILKYWTEMRSFLLGVH